jgi:hypothetical protein
LVEGSKLAEQKRRIVGLLTELRRECREEAAAYSDFASRGFDPLDLGHAVGEFVLIVQQHGNGIRVEHRLNSMFAGGGGLERLLAFYTQEAQR